MLAIQATGLALLVAGLTVVTVLVYLTTPTPKDDTP